MAIIIIGVLIINGYIKRVKSICYEPNKKEMWLEYSLLFFHQKVYEIAFCEKYFG